MAYSEDVKTALQDLLPGRPLTDADYEYWTTHGGLNAVQNEFARVAPSGPTQGEYDRQLQNEAGQLSQFNSREANAANQNTSGASGLSELWSQYGGDPAALQNAMQQRGVTAGDLAGQVGVDGGVMVDYLQQRLSPGYSRYKTLEELSAPTPQYGAVFGASIPADIAAQNANYWDTAYRPTSTQVDGGGFSIGGTGGGKSPVQPVPVAQSVSTPSSIPASDAISDHTINSWFLANPGWNTDMLKGFMSSYGLTPEQVARATGRNPTDFIKEVNAAGRLPAQAGAQTQYVDYTQPLSPIAQGAGSGNLPYYYNTPAGSLASYYNPTYLRGNISAYGGMMGKDLNLRQSVPAAPPPVQSVTYVPPPSPSPAPTTVPGLAPAAPVATQSDFDTWYADYMRRQNLLDRGFGTGSGSDGIGGGSEGSNGSSDGPSGEA